MKAMRQHTSGQRQVACTLAALALAGTVTGVTAAGVDCLLEPWQVVELRAPVDGLIAEINVTRGDLVRRGQPLVVLESAAERTAVASTAYRAQMEGQIASARNRIDYASRKLARMTEMQRDNFMSAQARDEAAAEKLLAESELKSALEAREMARLDWQRAQEQLAQRTMSAPFAGVVVDRMLNPGDLAESGAGRKPVMKLAQINPIRTDVVLPANLFGQVKVGTRATVTAVVGGRSFPAVVRGVDRLIDAASATFVARLEVPNPKGEVPGGSRCKATIAGLPPVPIAAVSGARTGLD